jgi:ABC-type polysaccharide/polyol phosphate export permease
MLFSQGSTEELNNGVINTVKSYSSQISGFGLFLAILFIFLKLVRITNWPWCWVLCPLIVIAIVTILWLLGVILSFVFWRYFREALNKGE